MLIVDQLKQNDRPLRLVAILLAAGMAILLAGLWWVQIVSAREYQSHLETQAYRTVRIPAMRGKILEREGRVLAENRARYNLSLYFDDLSGQFQSEYDRLHPEKQVTNSAPFWKFWNRSELVETQRVRLKKDQMDDLGRQARYNVASRIVAQVAQQLGQPLSLDAKKFDRAYQSRRALPFIILPDLDAAQIARFEEQSTNGLGASLELQAERVYPFGSMAAHVLGYLRSDDSSQEGEDADFNYRLPDYRGVGGIEGEYDSQLRGHAGEESVLVNNLGYRQSENILDPPVPGNDLVLTIDLDIQRTAEKSFLDHQDAAANGAVVVMDVRSGDVLAMVSSPTFDPNDFAQGISEKKWQEIQKLSAEKNRATFENYAPGSIFKTVVSLAALENGLNVNEIYRVQPDPTRPGKGCIYVGKRKIDDLAMPGDYDFKRAFIHSSNAYFVNAGLTRAGIENIIHIGDEFDLGERTGLFANQETRGNFPTEKQIHSGWRDGDTANVCIGQGPVDITPIQMAVMISAIANNGTVLWPRLVQRIEPQDFSNGETATNFPAGVVRDRLTVHPRSLQILRDAMLADVESAEGSGTRAAVSGLNICAKTGTAQVQDTRNRTIGYNYWFASFAPFENPKYAVVVMVQKTGPLAGYGGTICAPIAHDIYEEILRKENTPDAKIAARN